MGNSTSSTEGFKIIYPARGHRKSQFSVSIDDGHEEKARILRAKTRSKIQERKNKQKKKTEKWLLKMKSNSFRK